MDSPGWELQLGIFNSEFHWVIFILTYFCILSKVGNKGAPPVLLCFVVLFCSMHENIGLFLISSQSFTVEQWENMAAVTEGRRHWFVLRGRRPPSHFSSVNSEIRFDIIGQKVNSNYSKECILISKNLMVNHNNVNILIRTSKKKKIKFKNRYKVVDWEKIKKKKLRIRLWKKGNIFQQ